MAAHDTSTARKTAHADEVRHEVLTVERYGVRRSNRRSDAKPSGRSCRGCGMRASVFPTRAAFDDHRQLCEGSER